MFSAYIDDSGTDPNQRAAIATALVVAAAQIIPLEREWDKLKKKHGFSDFHTSEMVARNYKSDFADWDEAKQRRVFQRVREISRKYSIGSAAVSFAVNKADYDNVVPLEYRNHLGGHYTWAVRHLMNFLEAWKQSRKIPPLEYIFDWAEPGCEERAEIETVMAQTESISQQRGRPGEFTNYAFRRRKDVPALQCVDAIGWTCYQQALLQFRKVPMHKLADEAWKGYGAHLEQQGWLQCFTVREDNLRKWISAEIADGETLKRFAEFELTGVFQDPGPAKKID
jgi:Protein of unknown function (DUF3800)